MAFTVAFFTFAKKANSTAIPSVQGAEYQCTLKDDCGIVNPNIKIAMPHTILPVNYNYAHIPNFNRYYWVREWTQEQGVWVASFEVDVLASFKEQIGNYTGYVVRASNLARWNGAIQDLTYPSTASTTLEVVERDSPWAQTEIQGYYVIGIAGQATTYYTIERYALQQFMNYIMSDDYADALYDGWESAFPELKALTNPLQYITFLMWLPFLPTSGTLVNEIRVGWVDVPIEGTARQLPSNAIFEGILTFNIPKHPQQARGSYVNIAPFSTYNLFFPPWGKVSLDAGVVGVRDTLTARYYVDLRTGGGTLDVQVGDFVLSRMSTTVGVPYQVSQVINKAYGIGNAIAPVASTVGSLMQGDIGGAISSAASMIGDVARSKVPSANTIGSNGGKDTLTGTPTLMAEFNAIVSEDLEHRGRPVCALAQVSTLPGFLMLSDTDIPINGTAEEQRQITSLIESGFYYE